MAINNTLRRAVLLKNVGNCYLCGDPIDIRLPKTAPRAYEVEHIIPRSKGGKDVLGNLMPSHKICNGKKSDFPVDVAIRNLREAKWKTSRVW